MIRDLAPYLLCFFIGGFAALVIDKWLGEE